MRKLRIFAASPFDMAKERAKVETVAGMLNPLADNLGFVLDVVDWRIVVPDMGRPEKVILDQLEPTEWDVFIGVLWLRFGTPPGSKDAQTQKDYFAGTEEEFQVAYRLWKQYGKPRIMMYRCTRAIPPDALELVQIARVREFFTQFDAVKGDHPGLYQTFDSTEAFVRLLLDNMQRLLLKYGEQIRGKPIAPQVVQAYAPKIPDNLPRRAPFFGRDKEMAIVLRALSPEDRTWGVLVDGIGGSGKTALAVEAAYLCREKSLFDAFIFVSAKQSILAPSGIEELTFPARTIDEFVNETAHVLGQPGIAQLASPAKHHELLDALRSTRTLLVYDNLETLAKKEQEVLANFLRGLPQDCKAIITSRHRGGGGAVWLRLEKLEWEAARAIIENEMVYNVELATKLRVVREERWQELYDETKGSPLALVHILGLMRARTVLTFDGALEMLRGSRVPDLQKFIFQEARRELTINDQTALRALSFFASSSTFEAWLEVANLSRNMLETTIDRLSVLALVDVLVGEERFILHPLTRNFVQDELLADVEVTLEMGRRFAEYWVAYAVRYSDFEKKGYRSYEKIEAEWKNLEAAIVWLTETAIVQDGNINDQDAARSLNKFANEMATFLFFCGRWDELVALNASTYELMLILNDVDSAGWRVYMVAWIFLERDNISEAVRWIERCSEAWSSSDNRKNLVTLKQLRGLVAKKRKNFDLAEKLFKDALAILHELKSDSGISRLLNSLGNLEQVRKAYDAAERYFRDALELSEQKEDVSGIAVALGNLAEIAVDRERWGEACKWGERGLQVAREVGRRDLIASISYSLAHVHVARSRQDLALPLTQEAAQFYEQQRHPDLAKVKNLLEKLKGG